RARCLVQTARRLSLLGARSGYRARSARSRANRARLGHSVSRNPAPGATAARVALGAPGTRCGTRTATAVAAERLAPKRAHEWDRDTHALGHAAPSGCGRPNHVVLESSRLRACPVLSRVRLVREVQTLRRSPHAARARQRAALPPLRRAASPHRPMSELLRRNQARRTGHRADRGNDRAGLSLCLSSTTGP